MPHAAQLNELLHDDTCEYGRQRAAGFYRLRFEPALEAEFAEHNYAAFQLTRNAALTLLAFTMVGWLMWDVWQALRTGMPSEAPFIIGMRLLMIAVAFATMGIVWRMTDRRRGEAWVMFNLGVSGLGTMLILLGYNAGHGAYQLPLMGDGLIMMEIGFLFPLGNNVRRAAWVAVVYALVCLAVTCAFSLESRPNDVMVLVPFQITALVALLGLRYYQEYASRQQFLLQGSLWHLAGTDSLTGINNRRVFEAFMPRALSQGNRYRNMGSLMLVDIDHFKTFNDRYGHPAGDVAIRAIAQLLKERAQRPFDSVARLGGEEFALFLYDAQPDFVDRLARTLVQAVPRELAIAHSDNEGGYMTISVGVALATQGETYESLYGRADAALYRAKNQGRNRYEWAP